jgi:hypothetical protein
MDSAMAIVTGMDGRIINTMIEIIVTIAISAISGGLIGGL